MSSGENQNLSGTVIRGYKLLERIGRGGFGVIYRAYQEVVDREVAIKVIHPTYASQPDFIRRFEAEARVVARLEHPYIIPLYDYWRDTSGAYLVMRLLNGGSLRKMISRKVMWTLEDTVRLFDQITPALTLAHKRGVVHRDIKPENLLFDETSNAYLTDFGIALDLVKNYDVTIKNISFGSPAYLAPEEIVHDKITPLADIYSLGILLYEMLMHEVPFHGDTTKRLFEQHVSAPVPSVTSRRPDLPIALDSVIWRATAKQPDARFPDAWSFNDALRKAAGMELPAANVIAQVVLGTAAPATSGNTRRLDTKLVGKMPDTRPFGSTVAADYENPYKGLRAFDEQDAADFFGRDEVIASLLERLKTQTMLALVGPSGSGKSSLVRAGLMPALRSGRISRAKNWFTSTMTPGAEPYTALAEALARVAIRPYPSLETFMRSHDEGLLQSLTEILPADSSKLVLFIDQFEELFTLSDDEDQRRHFLLNLYHAVNAAGSRLRLILTLRADFYDRPLQYLEFGTLLQEHTEVLLPLTRDALEQAIRRPAERAGLIVEAGLSSRLIRDVSHQPGALPLLQYTLSDLFERTPDGLLRISDYEVMGGISGAIASRANLLYESLDEEQQGAARRLFLRLVTVEEDAEANRRRVLWSEVMSSGTARPQLEKVIQMFADNRLLTLDRDPATRAPTVEIAHEALLKEWERLREWLRDNRADLSIWKRLTAAAHDWEHHGRETGFLASGARLVEFEPLRSRTDIELSLLEEAYLNAAITQRQRAARRTRLIITALTLFSIVTLMLGLFALDRESRAQSARLEALSQRDRANQEALISGSRELAAVALYPQTRADLALLLSLEALNQADTYEARNSLLTAYQSHPFLAAYLHGATDSLRTMALSPDGSRVFAAGRDGFIWQWDSATDAPAGEALAGHQAWVNALALSPDGRWLASGDADGFLRLWDVQTGQPVGEALHEHSESIWGIAFAPDNAHFVTAGADGRVLRWTLPEAGDTATFEQLAQQAMPIYSVAISPDGSVIAAGGDGGTVTLWEATGAMRAEINDHTGLVLTLAFSPDGQYLVSAGADGRVAFHETAAGTSLGIFTGGHNGWIRRVAVSPDAQLLATASADGTIRLWNLSSGELIRPLTGHGDEVWDVVFAPAENGYRLLSAGADKAVIDWNLALPQPPGTLTMTAAQPVLALALSADGSFLALAQGETGAASGTDTPPDGMVEVWSIQEQKVEFTLTGHIGPVVSAGFNPAGTRLASGGADGSVRIWDTAMHDLVYPPLTGHTGVVYQVLFSPDGEVLYSAGDDGIIRLWHVETGEPAAAAAMEQPGGMLSMVFSPDFSRLATGGRDGTIRLWDVASQTAVGEALALHTDAVTALAFSPDGRYLLSSGRDKILIVYDLQTGTVAARVEEAHTDAVNAIIMQPDAQYVVTAGRDGTVRLWDFPSLRRIGQPLLGYTSTVNAAVFLPDGSAFITAGRERTVITWAARLEDWRNTACGIARRSLTMEEWRQYRGEDDPYVETCTVDES